MCGVARDKAGESDIVPPLEATMPPSITLGSEPPKPASGPGDHPAQQEPPASKDIPTIDLSRDENDDIQKAIALSLQDQHVQQVPATLTGISAEDQEVSRALEASLKESTPQATIDLINPQDRKRQPGVPVGLKNIGNSCWFNVIIQPLFHIPVFREMILNFSQNVDVDEQMEETQKASRQLVPALRKLFSLMIGSNRKYIDPTFAVHIFQGQEMRKNSQQDVCEFTHKLLERLEEEYHQLLRRQGVEKESECHVSKDADFENPIMRLFYGHTKKEICEEDEGPKQETFGQYPLHIMNYSSIHESILGSMVSTMPDMTGDTVQTVQQETWFKLLPPVLIFSLSRYEYSLEKKRAEKVHNKFEFPEFLYMDRYMEINKKLIKEKHIKVAKLKGELNSLTKTLDRYEKYGTGEAKYPISDILKYTLDFAQTGVNSGPSSDTNCVPSPSMMEVDGVETSENDVEMTEAPEVKKEMADESPSVKEEDAELPAADVPEQEIAEGIVKEEETVKDEAEEGASIGKDECVANCAEEYNPRTLEEEPQQMSSPSKRMRILPPAPRNITTSELSILQSCLSRWLQDMNTQVAELRRCISDLESQLNQMYDDPVLHRIPYRLHSVVVHEGQASGGHYWVYIFDNTRKTWMKFNDIQVVESNWEELLQDSVGGQNNASAYCLLYIDESRYEMIFPQPPESMESMMAGISIDLQEYVKNDTLLFMRELEEWDLKHEKDQGKEVARVSSQQQQCSAAAPWDNGAQIPATAPNSPDIICVEDADEANFFTDAQTMLSQTVLDTLTKDGSQFQANHGGGLNAILVREFSRLQGLANAGPDNSQFNSQFAEPAVLDFGIYLMRNKQNNDILLKWYGCEVIFQVAQNVCDRSQFVDRIILEASQYLQQVRDQHQQTLGPEYRGWRRHYRSLIDCMWCFVSGFKQYEKGHLEKALPILLKACRVHAELEERAPAGNKKTLDKEILWKFRRMCILNLSDRLLQAFIDKEDDQVVEISETIVTLVVPTLNRLQGNGGEEDNETAADIRQVFCRLLECDFGEEKKKLREQILEVVLSGSGGDSKGVMPCQVGRPPPVLSLYKSYIDACKTVMSVPVKSKAQTSDL